MTRMTHQRHQPTPIAGIALVLALAAWTPHSALAQHPAASVPGCGSLENAYGPWDFRKDRGEPLRLVESAHFSPQVESLIRGQTTNIVGADLDYTLRAFPNHHRALLATARLSERQKRAQPVGMTYTVECWFQRAIAWKADDHVARMLYSSWLAKAGRRDDALGHLKKVEAAVGPDNAITRYNLGLLYLDLQQYDAALALAHQAAALGYTRTELRDKLAAAGKWTDPPADRALGAAEAASSAASSAAPASSP